MDSRWDGPCQSRMGSVFSDACGAGLVPAAETPVADAGAGNRDDARDKLALTPASRIRKWQGAGRPLPL